MLNRAHLKLTLTLLVLFTHSVEFYFFIFLFVSFGAFTIMDDANSLLQAICIFYSLFLF